MNANYLRLPSGVLVNNIPVRLKDNITTTYAKNNSR